MIHFPISGVETWWWLPPLVAFTISCLTSTAGVSGAFLLMPFQVSVLGFAGPAASSTNLVYNVVGIPGGVFRYYREKRLVWSIAGVLIAGSLPGMFLGAVIRITYLPDPTLFKPFVGLVLLLLGTILLRDLFRKRRQQTTDTSAGGDRFRVTSTTVSWRRISYVFHGNSYTLPTMGMAAISFVVGIIGGAYGIGGGVIVAPLLVTVFGLPIYTIAGATLLSTFASSAAGILFYSLLAGSSMASGLPTAPDWMLGASLGAGGLAGTYVGARLQRFMPVTAIKAVLAACVLGIALKYIYGLLG